MLTIQDQLLGALIGLARATDKDVPLSGHTWEVMFRGLLASRDGSGEEAQKSLLVAIHAEKNRLLPGCAGCASPCGRTSDYDMRFLRDNSPGEREAKARILNRLRQLAGPAWDDLQSGVTDPERNFAFCRGLFFIGEDADETDLRQVLEELESL